jgi:23S rRNA (uracil1939-C5)-methyltransferase
MATTTALRLGQTFEVTIHGLGHEGQGVGRLDDLAVFVPGALPGERVVARLRRQAKRHLEAELVGVEDPSPDRRKPPCILVERCGGCSLQHCNDPAQADLKTDLVRQALKRLAQLKVDVLPILQAASPLGYRNRALIPLERTPEGQLRAGYYRRGSHKIVNMNRCPVLDPRIDVLIQPIKADLEATRWPVDVNLSQGGGLRHLSLRVGHHSGDVLITLVSSHNNLPGLEALAQQWQERWPEVVGVNLNIQPKATNVVLGPDTYQVSGRSWLLERFAGHELHIGADTFFQVNTAQAERVVPLLVDFFSEQPNTQVLEAYCGIGTFSLPLAAAGLDVLGLELHHASVAQARANAERNALPKARFEQADVAVSLAEHLAWAEALLVDPPRKGLAPEVMEVILQAPPRRIAYISCNPATLARDLGLLSEAGYRIRPIQPVDFFPQTSHVECLALLERD